MPVMCDYIQEVVSSTQVHVLCIREQQTFCTAPNSTSVGQESQKANARMGQASLGPPTWFPALNLITDLSKVRKVWLKLYTTDKAFAVLGIAVPQRTRFWSTRDPQLCRFIPWWVLASWEWFQGSCSQKQMKPKLIEKSETVTTGTLDSWGKTEHSACDWRSICCLVPFIVFSKVSFFFFPLEC